jgi:hypothetical protein
VQLLRDEYPEAYFHICDTLQGRSLTLVIDGDETWIVARRFELLFVERLERSDVEIRSDSATVLDVIDARLTLNSAIHGGRLVAIGSREDLSACHEALVFFVKGAVRTPSLPLLLQEFRWVTAQSS